MEGVPWDVITTSNTKEDTIMNIEQMMVNSNARAYHERGGSEKRAMWSSKGLNMRMYLKHGLQGVIKVNVQIGPNAGKSRSTEGRPKCLDHWHMLGAR